MANQEKKPPSRKENSAKIRENSPYSKNFKCYVRADQRDLVYKRQLATKLSRKDLEDRYIDLCDENFFIKRQNNELQEKVKKLMSKIIWLTNNRRSYSSSAILKENTSENLLGASSHYVKTTNLSSSLLVRSSSLTAVFRNTKSATLSDRSKNEPNSAHYSHASESNHLDEKGQIEGQEKTSTTVKEITFLKEQIESLKKDIMIERDNNSQILDEKQKLELQLSQIDLKKFLSENIEVNRLKQKLEHFKSAVRRIQEKYQAILAKKNEILEEEKKRYSELFVELNKERALNSTIIEKKNEYKSALRTIEILKKQILDLEFDKKSLIEQQESLSVLLKEAASYRNESIVPSGDNQELLETLELMKTEKAAIEHSKNDMFSKICQLQDMNDKLLVDIEGLKAERTLNNGNVSGYTSECVVLLSDGFPHSSTNVSIAV